MPSPFTHMSQVEALNRRNGFHFFDRETRRFFRSRIGSELIHGRFFVTSEQFVPSHGPAEPRRYTVKFAKHNGGIETVGSFQQFDTHHRAVAYARKLDPERIALQ